MMTVAVTGASGFVGRHVVRELLGRGHRVRALIRDGNKAREAFPDLPNHPTPDLVAGNVLDPAALDELLRGADACIHLVGIIREVGGGQTFERIHVAAPAAVVASCERAGVRRLLHMSALGAKPDSKAAYQRTKFAGELAVRRSGLDWTVFRPSVIIGPESEFVGMVEGLASGQEPPYYFLPYFTRPVIDESVPMGAVRHESARVQPVGVGDVAWAFAEALDEPESVGEAYNLVGPEVLTWPDLLVALRDALPGTDHRLSPSGLPGSVGVAVARAAKVFGIGGLLPFDAGQAAMAMEDSTADGAKARAHLRLIPRPFLESLAQGAPSR